jgi:hypothetical protein
MWKRKKHKTPEPVKPKERKIIDIMQEGNSFTLFGASFQHFPKPFEDGPVGPYLRARIDQDGSDEYILFEINPEVRVRVFIGEDQMVLPCQANPHVTLKTIMVEACELYGFTLPDAAQDVIKEP